MWALIWDGLQNGAEEVQDGGAAVFHDGAGGWFHPPGRVPKEQEEGMRLSVKMSRVCFSVCFV